MAKAVELLVGFAGQDRPWSNTIAGVLGQGGPLTWKAVEKLASDASTSVAGQAADRLAYVWGAPPPVRSPSAPDAAKVLPKAELDRLRAALAASKGKPSGSVIDGLTVSDCGTMAAFLVGMESKANDGFELGSFFAYRCGTDRKATLLRVTKAKDPMVRVAAAVYLGFEDEQLGAAKLKELSALPGDAGAWAAITAARRGDKKSLARALKVFEAAPEDSVNGQLHSQLQARLCVLLSNSASAPPVSVGCRWTPELLGTLEKWWAANGEGVTLKDPWMAELTVRKVDCERQLRSDSV